jgi:hypothetical protein
MCQLGTLEIERSVPVTAMIMMEDQPSLSSPFGRPAAA